ncbi:MAG: hypothetical protein JWP12_3573 [Bacteroidetes bacterium]|nr:hypothetical protein [Bacteroidota bacterium]
MTIQQLLSATIPWELLFLIVPIVLFYAFLKIRTRIYKQRQEEMNRRKHFFS